MALTSQQSQQLYGTPAYTAWGEAEAQADWKAKNPGGSVPNVSIPSVSTPSVQGTNGTRTSGQPGSAQDLINMGFYGYQGWRDTEALADYKATGGQGKGQAKGQTSGASMGALGTYSSPTINLPEMYKNLYSTSGISDKETQMLDLERKFLEQKGKISDNPFLSASMVDQRLQRLQRKYEEETTPLRNEIATAKADIETQLNLQTKQFDIESTQAKNALSYFNTLLDAGALDGASGEDIAEITRSTGIPSSMIQSAIQSRQKTEEVNSQLITSTADSGEVTATLINTDTGEIISQQSLGKVGNAQTSGGGSGLSVSQQQEADKQQTRTNLIGDIQRGAILRSLVGHYGGAIDVAEIYRLYNSYSPYGQAEESLENVEQGRFIA